ncbi:MAG: esterase [Kangiellaceae bacterium]|jgi:esterase
MPEILHYSEHFPQDTTNDISNIPVVVLLHGLFGSSDNLNIIRKSLQFQFRVISIDLPDHGKSPRSNAFSFDNYAQQVLLTLKQLGIHKTSIVGHSLGGKVAMWAAYLQPQLIDKLIILDIAPIAYKPRHQNVIHALKAVTLDCVVSRKHAQQLMANFIEDPATQAFLLKSFYEKDDQWYWRFNLDLLIRDYSLLSDWTLNGKVVYKDEVLFIKGVNSDYLLAEYQAVIKTQFPKASSKLVQAGHWLHAEKPQVVNSLITKHLLGV